jgi:transcriptional regulator with XRE-family HTH domain
MTETPSEAVAGALRAEMARRRVDTRELAERVGKSHAWVHRRMTGAVAVSVDDAHLLAEALGIDAGVLLAPATP